MASLSPEHGPPIAPNEVPAGISPADDGGAYTSPFFAFLANLFIPGLIFWQFGARKLGGVVLLVSLVGIPLVALRNDAPEWIAAGLFGLGVLTGLIAWCVFAREHLRR